MNLSISRDELSSCQCIMERKKETEKPVLHWSFLGLGSEKKWYGTHVHKPNGDWDDVADIVMIDFSESGHLVFRGSSALEKE